MRRRAAVKREVIPEPKYGSELLAQFINRVMVSGKKSLAERIVYQSLEILLEKVKKNLDVLKESEQEKQDQEKNDQENGEAIASSDNAAENNSSNDNDGSNDVDQLTAVNVFARAISMVSPQIEVKSRRVGGATYQIPIEVPAVRRISLAMRWIIAAARRRGEKNIANRIAGELFDALSKRGEAFKKREDTYRMAKANQAFAHFGWK